MAPLEYVLHVGQDGGRHDHSPIHTTLVVLEIWVHLSRAQIQNTTTQKSTSDERGKRIHTTKEEAFSNRRTSHLECNSHWTILVHLLHHQGSGAATVETTDCRCGIKEIARCGENSRILSTCVSKHRGTAEF